eukprot:GEMP01051557.1.p1 GENE.GEMP01051557.1~~GEMP01051557.1.p1  ORF type:complete len:252 (+),score=65.46 GEMP01051557.1:127-882(+)
MWHSSLDSAWTSVSEAVKKGASAAKNATDELTDFLWNPIPDFHGRESAASHRPRPAQSSDPANTAHSHPQRSPLSSLSRSSRRPPSPVRPTASGDVAPTTSRPAASPSQPTASAGSSHTKPDVPRGLGCNTPQYKGVTLHNRHLVEERNQESDVPPHQHGAQTHSSAHNAADTLWRGTREPMGDARGADCPMGDEGAATRWPETEDPVIVALDVHVADCPASDTCNSDEGWDEIICDTPPLRAPHASCRTR